MLTLTLAFALSAPAPPPRMHPLVGEWRVAGAERTTLTFRFELRKR